MLITILMLITLGGANVSALSADAEIYPTAILSFADRGAGLKGYGQKVSDVLFASLAVHPNIYLVDRQEINKIVNEYQLNLSGMVNPNHAVQVGQLTGTKILISGTITEIDNTLLLIAKIIGTETSRVFGASVKGYSSDDILPLVEKLADKVVSTISQRSKQIVPPFKKEKDVIQSINNTLGEKQRPKVTVRISERHLGQATIDPAAETEIMAICQQTKFPVFDSDSPQANRADIIIKGEGFSEFAGRRGDLISVKARLEVKALNASTGEIIAVDRQTIVKVDLAEQIAGKRALEQAAAVIAHRLLPKLFEK
jgi:TolB-like protein